MRIVLLLVALLSMPTFAQSNPSCKVHFPNPDAALVSYVGACKSGLAEGRGVAKFRLPLGNDKTKTDVTIIDGVFEAGHPVEAVTSTESGRAGYHGTFKDGKKWTGAGWVRNAEGRLSHATYRDGKQVE